MKAKRTSGVVYGGLLTLVGKGKDLVLLPLFVGSLGAGGYGELTMLLLIASVLSIFMSSGMDVSIIRHVNSGVDDRRELATAITVVLLMSVPISIIWALAAEALLRVFELRKSGYLYWTIWGISVTDGLRGVVLGYLRGANRFKAILSGMIIPEVLEVGLYLYLYIKVPSKMAVGLILVCTLLFRFCPLIVTLTLIRPAFTLTHRSRVVDRMTYGILFVPKELLTWASHSADRLLVAYLLGLNATGIYTAAYKIASVVKIVSQPISFDGFPRLSASWDRGDWRNYFRERRRILLTYLAIALPIVVVLIALSDYILAVVSRGKVLEGGYVIPWVATGMLLYTWQGLSGYYTYVISKNLKEYLLIIALAIGAGLLVEYELILRFGLLGAAIGSCFSYCLLWVIVESSSRRLTRQPVHVEAH